MKFNWSHDYSSDLDIFFTSTLL
ncbi:hypothetical protein CGLO_18382 [Colletotrichum gloeosporioides Cg-14]|uniref:Uncharacterized protein n=1 Tax=Colletotrichum gloeosporioides (strain Cg-14) TaxID=1237896 RepID=T0JI57_COLGC|nr:hypothetical protein CGLO_18382 [Colletotrichum gloeosporioides Cg-14]